MSTIRNSCQIWSFNKNQAMLLKHLNVDAIVRESTPYLVAIYTAGLGGTTPESSEISGVGLYQLGQLAYVINEWHRVNMNE